MSAPTRIAVVGMGKIAHDQHLPAIHADPAFDLVATVILTATITSREDVRMWHSGDGA